MKGYLQNTKGEEIILQFQKTKRPSMSEHRGRTWDFGYVEINLMDVKVWLDTTWGDYLYFEWDGSWYKFRMSGCPWITKTPEYDIDPFGKPARITL